MGPGIEISIGRKDEAVQLSILEADESKSANETLLFTSTKLVE
jgi:hypothetical protein